MGKVADIGAFSLSQIYWIVIIHVVAHITHLILMKWTEWYPKCDMLVQRNCVSYILEVLLTTPILIGLIYYGWQSFKEEFPISLVNYQTSNLFLMNLIG